MFFNKKHNMKILFVNYQTVFGLFLYGYTLIKEINFDSFRHIFSQQNFM